MPTPQQKIDAQLRPTQNFVATITWCRNRPSLTLLEIAWRWIFGIPTLLALMHYGSQILASVPWRSTGIAQLSINQLLTDPMRGSATVAQALMMVAPPALVVAKWLAPLLILAWAIVSALGRTLVLRRMDENLHARPFTLLVLNVVRLIPLCGGAALWWFALSAVAQKTILQPSEAGEEPQVMVYIAAAIALSLGLFLFWAAIGWIFTAAPLLAMRDGLGPVASLRAAMRLGGLRGGLVEINLVMGIVKIALLVLALVFSATPLPFQTVITDDFLFWWTFGVGVVYCIGSDFFHVARLAGYLHLWAATESVKS
ncbi:hypothetical protein [Terriglobus saanensis]|uniref:Uncharacterized protein n=1 Tax=Terriglobus saanensis (strain ATCC BAA-1853 / DSM 23119 / SP1PR4) TaxID=401053 RepID=E8V6S4_TERSS|nr:hypothetical protein [Terriglobus saanensis]ADV83876.1 hypothetical protein AciPR4_3118 [Terriglobus saanensis SP1PR4]